ncbi:MAG: type II toxin-antitoxin system VapC family toxin [Candidatus Chisholmbacteria bacterium]|nr:type II toxin-antitoxin system VapC family toxin [Candidatus Chisholmbacteria bacterium]
MAKLLDTNVFVDYFRGQIHVKDYFKKQTEIVCSVVTAAELIQGSRNKREQNVNRRLLAKIKVLSITPAISSKMLSLMETYALSHGLEIPDALIGATAIEENLILVTANIKHFSFIKGLKLVGWKSENT